MNLEDMINNPQLAEESFKNLSANHTADVLFNDFENDSYRQTFLIKLDGVPVAITATETKISNDIFVNILKNSKKDSLSSKLDASKSSINRRKMNISKMMPKNVEDKLIASYIDALGLKQEVYVRQSTFSCHQQTMELKEYVLPGLQFIINKNK